jgi:hypothetical protein
MHVHASGVDQPVMIYTNIIEQPLPVTYRKFETYYGHTAAAVAVVTGFQL